MRKFLMTLLAVSVVRNAFATAGDDDATSKLYVDTNVATRQDAATANNANTVMTYTDTAGTVGTKGIYDASGSYAEQQNALVSADVANAAIMNAINMEFECAEWNPNDDTDCWKWRIHNTTERASGKNLFDISQITNKSQTSNTTKIVNNGDGSIAVTDSIANSAIITTQTLAQLAPDLIAGRTYTLSFNTTGCAESVLIKNLSGSVRVKWRSGESETITEDMLDSNIFFYACYNGQTPSTATISDIQIEEGTTATAYEPYQNLYLPAGN